MTANYEIFHNATAASGGRFPRELAPARVRAAYDEMAERAEGLVKSAQRALPRLPHIHFDFIHNGAINAVAFRVDGQHFIGVHTGLLYMLRMVIGRMLADARVFPSIGDPKEEKGDLEPLKDYLPDADEMHGRESLLTPNNAARRSYAWFLQDQALMFFVGHEIAHISRGHVDYLKDKRGMAYASELGWIGKKSREQLIERQCLEQDADRRSIMSRIDSLRKTFQHPDYRGAPWATAAKGPGQLIFDWTVSVNILFRLFGDARFSRSELDDSSYPPLALRRIMSEAAADYTIRNGWDANMGSISRSALIAGRLHTERAFAVILGEKVSMEGVQDAFSPHGRNHAIRLEEYWNKTMSKKLEPYSYES